jgi:hypothetical protein
MMNDYPATTEYATPAQTGSPLGSLVILVFVILTVVAYWKIFEKAGVPGWKALIPIYNIYILLQIIGKPWWWLLLFLVPIVNWVMWLLVAINVGKAFGKGLAWSIILLFLLPIVGAYLLAFSDAKYSKP